MEAELAWESNRESALEIQMDGGEAVGGGVVGFKYIVKDILFF